MPAPEPNSPERTVVYLYPLHYKGHNPDAPCITPKLEDFAPKSMLETAAKEIDSIKGGTFRRSLQIDFEPDEDDPDGERYMMESFDSVYSSDLPLHATSPKLLEGSERAFRARLEGLPSPYTDVVLKFGTTDEERADLKKEHDFYQNKLRCAQNVMVPFCIGLFKLKDDGEKIYDGELYCLVLHFVGEPILCAFDQLPAQERLWIFSTVDALHACGLQHNDLHERNLRLDRKAEKAWIVDFEMAEEHKCKHQPIVLGDLEPLFWKFGCPELFDLAIATKIWLILGTFNFCSRPIPLNEVFSWRDLVSRTPRDWPQEKKEDAAKWDFQYIQRIVDEKTDEFFKINSDWFPATESEESSEASADAQDANT